MGLFSNKEQEKELVKQFRKYKITAKQEGGDDGYCYVIRVNGLEFINGLNRSEVPYYKKKALESILKKKALESILDKEDLRKHRVEYYEKS